MDDAVCEPRRQGRGVNWDWQSFKRSVGGSMSNLMRTITSMSGDGANAQSPAREEDPATTWRKEVAEAALEQQATRLVKEDSRFRKLQSASLFRRLVMMPCYSDNHVLTSAVRADQGRKTARGWGVDTPVLTADVNQSGSFRRSVSFGAKTTTPAEPRTLARRAQVPARQILYRGGSTSPSPSPSPSKSPSLSPADSDDDQICAHEKTEVVGAQTRTTLNSVVAALAAGVSLGDDCGGAKGNSLPSRRRCSSSKRTNKQYVGATLAQGAEGLVDRKLAWLRQVASRRVPVHPASLFRIVWDLVILSLVLVVFVRYPYVLAFREPKVLKGPPDGTLASVMSLFSLADVMLNLVTGVQDPSSIKVEMRFGRVVRAYAGTWLLPDLCAAMPVIYLGRPPGVFAYAAVAKGVRLLSFLTMLKTWRVKGIAQTLGVNLVMHPFVVTMSAWTLLAGLFLHYVACAVCFIWLQSDESFMADASVAYGAKTSGVPELVLDHILNPLYIDSWGAGDNTTCAGCRFYNPRTGHGAARLYLRAWRVSQGFLQSHGQFVGTRWEHEVLSCVASLLGSLLYKGLIALCLATFIRIVGQRTSAGQKARSQHLEQYLRRNKTIPEGLRCRARRYIEVADNLFKDVFENIHESARTKQVRGSVTAGVSGLMSQSDYTPEGVMHQQTGLARKIKQILRANPKVVKMIRTLPFLHSGDQALIASLSASLRHEVCAKMDTIECIGEVASNFFMIEHGLVLYTSATNNLSDRIQSIMPRLDATNAALSADCNTDEDFEEYLEEGEFWGEVALLFSHTVRRRAVALTHGGLYRLSREHFLRLSEDYPHVAYELHRYVSSDAYLGRRGPLPTRLIQTSSNDGDINFLDLQGTLAPSLSENTGDGAQREIHLLRGKRSEFFGIQATQRSCNEGAFSDSFSAGGKIPVSSRTLSAVAE